MAIEFQNFTVSGVGELIQPELFGWVKLNFYFTDSDTKAFPSIEIGVPIQYDRAQSVDAVQKAAFEKARIVLDRLTAVVAAHDLAELRRLNDEREAAEAKQLDEVMNLRPD
jgi:hypothetical protein